MLSIITSPKKMEKGIKNLHICGGKAQADIFSPILPREDSLLTIYIGRWMRRLQGWEDGVVLNHTSIGRRR